MIIYSRELIQEMRSWVEDCTWADIDYDSGDIDDLTDTEIIRGVERHYGGGIEEFIRNGA